MNRAAEAGIAAGSGAQSPDGGCRNGSNHLRPDTLAADDDRFLLAVASGVCDRGLAAPVLLWLESMRPLSFVGAQLMHFATPFVRMAAPGSRWPRLASLLEDRTHLTRLLDHIEAVAAAGRRPGVGE